MLPYHRQSYVLTRGAQQIVSGPRITSYYLRKEAHPGEGIWPNAEFALKHEGLNLDLFARLFKVLDADEVARYVAAHPTRKYTRIIWFLYEWLTGCRLNIQDLEPGHYVLLLDPNKYFTGRSIKEPRYLIKNNLLGNRAFCPLVRKTAALRDFEVKNLSAKAKQIIEQYNPSVISRAVHYLYAKEIMSSYEIEKERPDKKRTTRFIRLLQNAGRETLDKEYLIALQNSIVDERFAEPDYRSFQNYVGENISLDLNKIHFVAPKPEDVSILMEGLLEAYQRMKSSGVPAVVTAATIAFGFVYIHPFGDGNGRIHRLLIHDILTQQAFTPRGLIFPVSATMLSDMVEYDRCLKSFSQPLLEVIDYDIDRNGYMSVKDETRVYYQYIDMTPIVEYLYDCIEKTINNTLKEELAFIVNYDQAKKRIQAVIDMPDRMIDLFIKLTTQNEGLLSNKKRREHFSQLTDDEVSELEEIVKRTMLVTKVSEKN